MKISHWVCFLTLWTFQYCLISIALILLLVHGKCLFIILPCQTSFPCFRMHYVIEFGKSVFFSFLKSKCLGKIQLRLDIWFRSYQKFTLLWISIKKFIFCMVDVCHNLNILEQNELRVWNLVKICKIDKY